MNFCLDTSAIWQFVGYIILVIKIVVPLLIIILGIVDLTKAVVSSDEKAINMSIHSVVQRVIVGIIIFFIPTIVSFVFSLVKEAAPFMNKATECQVCLLKPNSEECNGYKEAAKQERENRNNND